MKKAALLFCLVWIAFFSQAQQFPTNPETGRILFSEVVPMDSTTKVQLYLRAKEFMVKSFGDANSVIQMDDREGGVIMGKGYSDVYYNFGMASLPYKLWYTIKLETKDNRYRYEISDFEIQDLNSAIKRPAEKALISPNVPKNKKGEYRNNYGQYIKANHAKMVQLSELIKSGMSKSVSNRSDW